MTSSNDIKSAFIRLLYFGCRLLGWPLLVLYFLYRGYRNPRYFKNFAERLGGRPDSYQATPPGSIWLHAVSVGEVLSSVRLIEELRARSPGVAIYVSVTTLAGRATAEAKLRHLADGVFYAPIDYPFAIRRVLRRIRPAAVVILETELWPALYHETKRAQCALLIVNGRISSRAFPRYHRSRWLFGAVLRLPDAILVQSEADRARYLELGAPASAVSVGGNLKYDARPPQAAPPGVVTDLVNLLRPEAVWIAASTMPPLDAGDIDEDRLTLDAFRELARRHPRLLLIWAPRKPERFGAAAELLRQSGVCFMRRSTDAIPSRAALPCVLLLDSIGELAAVFPLATAVFLGGTLARRGGHNILEPALCAKPVVIGPHMENFAEIAAEFRARGALVEIASAAELVAATARLLEDAALRELIGARAFEIARQRRGAAERAAEEILKLHDLAIPVWERPGPSRPLLWALSRLWMAGSRLRQARDARQARSLSAPGISIGGISMGGTGKTPLAQLLARRLRERGHNPAILTRGYGRKSIEEPVAVPAGATAPLSDTGDEAQIFIRDGCAHVGIGGDRLRSAALLEKLAQPDVFLLDDGFQHRRLRRDLDIVLVDALNPFAGGAVFPLGGLREPPRALKRAGAIVLTRTQPGREYRGIRQRIRAENADAPIFLASVRAAYWVDQRTQERIAAPPRAAVAFCGLANPSAFWQTLRLLGIEPVSRWVFGDHHRYRNLELRRLAAQAKLKGATALLTTEKDAINLPDTALETLAPIGLYWLKIETVLDDEEALLALIEARMARRRGAGA